MVKLNRHREGLLYPRARHNAFAIPDYCGRPNFASESAGHVGAAAPISSVTTAVLLLAAGTQISPALSMAIALGE
jgi:hypothetical protein